MKGEEGYGEQGYTTVGKEHYTVKRRSHLAGFLSFFMGGAVGAAAALLLTPQPGRITRQQIKEASLDMKELLSSYYSAASERMGTAAGKGMEVMKEGKPLFMAAIEAGREAYEREKQRVAKGL